MNSTPETKQFLTPEERKQFQKWMAANHYHYWFTDEARKQVLKAGELTAWSFDDCMKRLNDLKAQLEATGDLEIAVTFFDKLRSYGQHEDNNQLPHPAQQVALHEENTVRIYKLWFKHFDAWYSEFVKQMEQANDDYAF